MEKVIFKINYKAYMGRDAKQKITFEKVERFKKIALHS